MNAVTLAMSASWVMDGTPVLRLSPKSNIPVKSVTFVNIPFCFYRLFTHQE